ncbi:metallophosphoesterase [Roseomonas sp. HF4]|uniref:metallophosphoesterase n=1 Tax=Roseomonas sp. HF4 TaxID=2562313 RepID=UPI001F0D8119|nr:metallophosphoesterase [Roseomonas sp. HF4]
MTSLLDGLRAAGFRGLRVVGDVHGDARGLEAAIAGAEAAGLFLVQLGDLTDHGPDSPAALRLMFAAMDAGRGLFLLGNHDHKLRRALLGDSVRIEKAGLGRTLEQVAAARDAEALAQRAILEIGRAPAWLGLGRLFCVHAAFHDSMLLRPPPPDAGQRKPDGLVGRAIFGQVTGARGPDGFPIRLTGWVDRIPAGLTVLVGHDNRSRDGRPPVFTGAQGGRAVFLDTGAGKGGALAWQDFPFDRGTLEVAQGHDVEMTG